MRKIKSVSLLLIVFALPVLWYLFLQFFGENKFELPKFGPYCEACEKAWSVGESVLLVDTLIANSEVNEWNRILYAMKSRKEIAIYPMTTEPHDFPMVVIDSLGEIRGYYQFSREETDRLLTELDIYLIGK